MVEEIVQLTMYTPLVLGGRARCSTPMINSVFSISA